MYLIRIIKIGIKTALLHLHFLGEYHEEKKELDNSVEIVGYANSSQSDHVLSTNSDIFLTFQRRLGKTNDR